MTRTHIIVFAQGPELEGSPKPWMRLPGTGPASVARGPGTPIIMRTITQIYRMADLNSAPRAALRDDITPISLTVVCAAPLHHLLAAEGDRLIGTHTLTEPGNSTLDGIDRYLRFRFARPSPYAGAHERIVVLLGDVVYSWNCLHALLCSPCPISFVGTSDLSPSRGHLWGVTWETEHHAILLSTLEAALAKHPPVAAYRPKQFRQWFFAGQADDRIASGAKDRSVLDYVTAQAVMVDHIYQFVDDYTQDIDVPTHLELLEHPGDRHNARWCEWRELGRQAAVDDEKNGLVW